MRIGILGAGKLGTGIAKQLVHAKHEIFLSFSRDADKTAAFADSIGAQSGAPSEAAQFGEVIALTAPWTAVPEVLREAGPLDGKILWDCTNPLQPDLGGLMLGTTTSAGEEVSRMVPTAKVVKAIPPFADLLHGSAIPGGRPRPATFVCGDDPAARRVVAGLVDVIGAEPVDAGPLSAARFTEPTAMLLVHLAYKQGLGPRIGAAIVRFA